MNNTGKVIMALGSKGGVGTTQIALTLANFYSKQNKKVLLIDADVTSGGIALILGKTPKKDIYNLIKDIETNKLGEIHEYLTKYNDNISFISAPIDIRAAALVNIDSLNKIMYQLKLNFDYIIIDTNHSMTSNNVILMEMCDKALIITDGSLISLKNTRNINSALKIADMHNYLIVLNDSVRKENSLFSIHEMRNIIGTSINYTIPCCFYKPNLDKLLLRGELIDSNKCSKNVVKHFEKLIKAIDREDI
jgi:pilus assembly protein CpaE